MSTATLRAPARFDPARLLHRHLASPGPNASASRAESRRPIGRPRGRRKRRWSNRRGCGGAPAPRRSPRPSARAVHRPGRGAEWRRRSPPLGSSAGLDPRCAHTPSRRSASTLFRAKRGDALLRSRGPRWPGFEGVSSDQRPRAVADAEEEDFHAAPPKDRMPGRYDGCRRKAQARPGSASGARAAAPPPALHSKSTGLKAEDRGQDQAKPPVLAACLPHHRGHGKFPRSNGSHDGQMRAMVVPKAADRSWRRSGTFRYRA